MLKNVYENVTFVFTGTLNADDPNESMVSEMLGKYSTCEK
jgi:hypothetical protein